MYGDVTYVRWDIGGFAWVDAVPADEPMDRSVPKGRWASLECVVFPVSDIWLAIAEMAYLTEANND